MLNLSLIINACKRVLIRKILWFNADKKRRICVFSVTCKRTHTVYYYTFFFTCCRNDRAAGAHTKCICTSLVKSVARKLVISRTEFWMISKSAVLSLVNKFLRMLDSCADRKRLLHNVNAEVIKHFNRISCTVAYCHNYRVCFKVNAFALVLVCHSVHKFICNNKPCKFAFKPYFAA